MLKGHRLKRFIAYFLVISMVFISVQANPSLSQAATDISHEDFEELVRTYSINDAIVSYADYKASKERFILKPMSLPMLRIS